MTSGADTTAIPAPKVGLSIDVGELSTAVRAATLKLQSQQVWPVLVSNLAIALIILFALWPLADQVVLSIWAGLVWALAWFRFFGWRRCPVDDLGDEETARRWGRFAIAVSAAAGILWGGAPIVFFAGGFTPEQLLLVLVSAGMAAGHAAAQSAYIRAFLAYIVPGALPLGIFYLARPSQIEVFVGILVLLFAGSVTNIAITHRREFTELVRLRLEVARARDAAEAGSRAKNEFLSVISHELRTPLTSIRGALELLQTDTDTRSDQSINLIDMALNNTDRLAKIIDDLLDIEKMESGKMTFDLRRLKVRPLIEDAVSMNRGYAERFDVSLIAETDAEDFEVLGERDRLLQVLTNLLSNAVKFSPRGDTVKILARAVDDKVRMSVVDRGEGIPSDFQPHLFDRFAQADSTDRRRHGGSGLGLNITKAIVDGHGGTIGFETAAEVGTTFYVDLPRFGAAAVTGRRAGESEQ